MAFSVIQAGSTLQFVSSGGLVSTLTLPTGVTLRSDLPPRWEIFNNYVILVNTPSTPLIIDHEGVVRVLTPKPPQLAPVLAAGAAGGLSGTYAGVRVTFLQKDVDGNLISESDYSPGSGSVTVSAQNIAVSSLSTSNESIQSRRLYRPTTGGTTLFGWLDVDGNTITSTSDDLSDAGLELIASPTLGTPPRLTLIREWRNRLWGVGDVNIDDLLYCEAAAFYAWPSANSIPVAGSGSDEYGITALMPRREALGIGRKSIIWQMTGQTPDDFRLVKLSENCGVESQESVTVYRDTVFWLWKDGVYQWDSQGIRNISDPSVSSWFNTNSYFNPDMFSKAFAVIDPARLKYRLFLASAGSTTINRWVEYDLATKTWWGPHKTSAFSPSSAFLIPDSKDKVQSVIGSGSAFIWEERDYSTDSLSDGIDFDVDTPFFDADTPDLEKVWGELSVFGDPHEGIIRITPKLGYINSSPTPTITYNMNKGRERLRRLGQGKLMQLNLKHSREGEDVNLSGLQVPYFIVGRR